MSETYRFVIPVTITITGWVEVKAKDKEEAIQQAKKLQENGVSLFDVRDSSEDTDVHIDEIELPAELEET